MMLKVKEKELIVKQVPIILMEYFSLCLRILDNAKVKMDCQFNALNMVVKMYANDWLNIEVSMLWIVIEKLESLTKTVYPVDEN